MAKRTVTLKFLVNRSSRSEVVTRQARIDTDATVEDLLEAILTTEAYKSLVPKQSPQLYVAVPKQTDLNDLGIRENDVILILGKEISSVLEPVDNP